MQEIETIRRLICEQIEDNNCLDTTDCQEHKRHFGILTDVITELNQLEARLAVAKEALEFYYYQNNVRNNYGGNEIPDDSDNWQHFGIKAISRKNVTLAVERGKRAEKALAIIGKETQDDNT